MSDPGSSRYGRQLCERAKSGSGVAQKSKKSKKKRKKGWADMLEDVLDDVLDF